MAPFLLLIAFHLYATLTESDSIAYVSREGIDTTTCGLNVDNACGTLYHASRLALARQGLFVIHVVDGQNEAEISNITNTTHDPCLPMPFASNLQVTITFNAANIHDLDDWYPRNICENDTNKNYKNEYMFDGGKSLKINNLVINNYGTKHFYPFIRSTLDYNASITCIQCRFESIVYDTWDGTHSNPLFHTIASIYIIRSSFINLDTSITWRFTSTFVYPPLVYCDAGRLIRDAERFFYFIESVFINITHIQSIVDIKYSSIRDADRLPTVMIKRSLFEDISVKESIINDETQASAIIINDASFDNIISGSIYFATLASASKNVRMDNVSVTSIAQLFKNNRTPLFNFIGTDVTVLINALTIQYIYNTDKSCKLSSKTPHIANTAMNVSCEVKYCSNPANGIYAVGTVQMTNVKVNMEVVPDQQAKCTQFKFYSAADGKPMAFINNAGDMSITNMSIGRPIGHEFIYNSNILSVRNLSFNSLDTARYDPNGLCSDEIIKTQGEFNVLSVSHSYFYGAKTQIYAKGGVGTVSDSVFEQTAMPINIDTCDKFTVMRNDIKNIGMYNGLVKSDASFNDFQHYPFRVWTSKDIELINNSISGFDSLAIVFVGYTENITMMGNIFNVDTSQLLYNVAPKYLSFDTKFASPVYVKASSNIKLIGNIFDKNDVDPDNQWLRYRQNEGVNCLSGNTFTNVAIYATETNLTSCFRPSLIDGVYNGSTFTDASLLGKMNHFLLDANAQKDIVFVLSFSQAKIALDQINITWINTDHHNTTLKVPISMDETDLLIVDSFITNDISYTHKGRCNVLHNDRLSDNIEGVARLRIICDDVSSNGYTSNQTLDSNHTRLVEHFSATKLNFSAESSYYPGELLHFEYHITDILGNIIDYPLPEDGLVVQLHSNRFSTQLNINHLESHAILLTDVSINNNAGDEYDIYVDLEKNLLVSEYPMIALNITGCPMGFGPDSNNISCVVCNTDSYNLIRNNVERCSPCNPDSNSGIKCMDGTILVAEGHWVGFDSSHSIISSICPPSYCCTKPNKCDYEKKEELCALHRDPDSVLCSSCLEGYSESMNSINCVRCNTSYAFEFLLMPMLLALCLSVIVMKTDNVRKNEKEDAYLNPFMSRFRYMRVMITIMISKCILYYEQSISEIVFKLTPFSHFSSIFNLSVIANSFASDSNGMCFMDGLNAKQKILMDLMVPVAMILICASFYCVFLLLNRRSLTMCCGRRQMNFGQMFVSLFILAVGKLLNVLFQLLSCKTVGDRVVHFYFANETCFGATWCASFVCLFIIIFSFCVLFYKIWRMSAHQRQSPAHATFIITSRYKQQYYLWEFVLFIRRILIALFAAFAHEIMIKLMFLFVMTCFTAAQHFYAPFLIHEANNMESVLLHCLIFVIMIQLFDLDEMFVSVLLSILIIFPVPLMLYFMVKVACIRKHAWNTNKQQIADDSDTGDDHDGVVAVVNGKLHRRMTAGNNDNSAVEIEMSTQNVLALCDECRVKKQCRIFEDGSFYCMECRMFDDEDLYNDIGI
eukprot:25907_1